MTDTPEEIIGFWFGDALVSLQVVTERAKLWFHATEAFDREITDRFGSLPERAMNGEFDAWSVSPRSALALILILDQFPRNLFRGEARAFAFDSRALEVALASISSEFDRYLHPLFASFLLYLPLEHSEDLALQERSVELFEKLLGRVSAEFRPRLEQSVSFAVRHREVIHRFGRFPIETQLSTGDPLLRNCLISRPAERPSALPIVKTRGFYSSSATHLKRVQIR